MGISIFFDGGGIIKLPVNPPTLKVTVPGENIPASVIELGQINKLRYPGLKKLSFESFFPNRKSYFYTSNTLHMSSYTQYFENAMYEKYPIKIFVSGLENPIAMRCTVENFEHGFTGGDADCEYSIELLEHRPYSIDTKRIHSQTSPSPATEGLPRENSSGGLSAGMSIQVNGQLYKDPDGRSPGNVESISTRKIHLILEDAPFPVHIMTLDGGWRGWASRRSCKGI